MTEAQMLIRLKKLCNVAGRNYYERIKIACTLLDNKEWVRSSFRNDAYKAAEFLEMDYFSDLCQARTIWELIRIYRRFPERSKWEDRKYNLTVLSAACEVKKEKAKSYRKGLKKADFEVLNKENKDLQFQLGRADKQIQEKVAVIEGLEGRVKKLEVENNYLKGRVDELERIVDKRFNVA